MPVVGVTVTCCGSFVGITVGTGVPAVAVAVRVGDSVAVRVGDSVGVAVAVTVGVTVALPA